MGFVFISSLVPELPIACPFGGVIWDGTHSNLAALIREFAMFDGKITPCRIAILGSDRELVIAPGYSHADANKGDVIFLYENKNLILSTNKLSNLFNAQLV